METLNRSRTYTTALPVSVSTWLPSLRKVSREITEKKRPADWRRDFMKRNERDYWRDEPGKKMTTKVTDDARTSSVRIRRPPLPPSPVVSRSPLLSPSPTKSKKRIPIWLSGTGRSVCRRGSDTGRPRCANGGGSLSSLMVTATGCRAETARGWSRSTAASQSVRRPPCSAGKRRRGCSPSRSSVAGAGRSRVSGSYYTGT